MKVRARSARTLDHIFAAGTKCHLLKVFVMNFGWTSMGVTSGVEEVVGGGDEEQQHNGSIRLITFVLVGIGCVNR